MRDLPDGFPKAKDLFDDDRYSSNLRVEDMLPKNFD